MSKAINIEDLKASNDFLNILFDNITSAVFILDENIKVLNFNNAFKSLFHKEKEEIIDKYCGNAIGCGYAEKENVECGRTSFCSKCELRKNLLELFTQKIPTYKEQLEREFLIRGKFVRKVFLYTVKNIEFHNKNLILVIVDDITSLIEMEEKMLNLQQKNTILAMGVTTNHEINQPLSILKMKVEILINRFLKKDDPDAKKIYVDVNSSIDKINNILKKYADNDKYEVVDYTDGVKMIKFKDEK